MFQGVITFCLGVITVIFMSILCFRVWLHFVLVWLQALFFMTNILCFRVVTFAILIVLACCPNVRRNYPSNLILLAIFVSVKFSKLILHVIFESIVCNFTHTHTHTHSPCMTLLRNSVVSYTDGFFSQHCLTCVPEASSVVSCWCAMPAEIPVGGCQCQSSRAVVGLAFRCQRQSTETFPFGV